MAVQELPVPPHFEPEAVGRVWRVPYQQRAEEAASWATEHGITPASDDRFRICLVAVDTQNTFCIPDFELFVSGRSGTGAVEDNQRLCRFIYRNLHHLTLVAPTMDTHQAIQIFHSIFVVDDQGNHPPPFTSISSEDIETGRWRFNPETSDRLDLDPDYCQRHLQHYTKSLEEGGKYELTIWPYHAMLGGIGHALVSAVEEALFFHGIARRTQPAFQLKGNLALTEHYSVLRPEILTGSEGKPLGQWNQSLIDTLGEFDAVVLAGQAKSHCVAWTIADLLESIQHRGGGLAENFYLLEDCTSPVVVPGLVDYTEQGDAAFERFAEAGMRIVRSTDAIASWPGIELED